MPAIVLELPPHRIAKESSEEITHFVEKRIERF